MSAKVSVTSSGDTVLFLNRLGANPSMLNGDVMNFFIVYEANQGDRIEPVKDLDLSYTVTFEGEPIENDISVCNGSKLENSTKRKSSTELEEKENKKARNSQEPNSSKEKRLTPKDDEEEASPCSEDKWEELDGGKLYVFTSKGLIASKKIAGYDVDGTIIKTKSGNVFPKNIDDWQIAFNEVPGKLKSLHKDGYKIVFFTNQAGIAKGKLKIADFRKKIERIVSKINVPVQVFVSTGKGKYRKPVLGMWEILELKENQNKSIDKSNSFYCGDAAGRPEVKAPNKRKKDFSCSDRLFALNIGVPFYTPEQHFQNSKQVINWTRPAFDPTKFNLDNKMPLTIPTDVKLESNQKEVIIMVGSPASGKSSFAKNNFSKYVYINRDTLGTWQKCVAALEKALVQENKSAVIDNTNPDVESRKRYIEVAKKHAIPCRCFVMNTTEAQAKHNNVFRELTDPFHLIIKDLIFSGYKSKYVEPVMNEGYTEIVKVNCLPKFDDPDKEKLYKLYLVEK